MYKPTLEQLADGIFAIVMTLLVIDFHVPVAETLLSNSVLLEAIKSQIPVLLAYILSFLVLFTYWIAHHYLLSLIASNLNRTLTYLNIPFLMFVALIPFSAKLIGIYYYSQVAIWVYGMNVVLIGLALIIISHYTVNSREITINRKFSKEDLFTANIRILFPPAAALIAIAMSFINPLFSVVLFLLSVLINLIPGGLRIFVHSFKKEFRPKKINPKNARIKKVTRRAKK